MMRGGLGWSVPLLFALVGLSLGCQARSVERRPIAAVQSPPPPSATVDARPAAAPPPKSQPFLLPFDEFAVGDFYRWFHLLAVYAHRDESGLARVSMKTGGFHDSVDLHLILDQKRNIVRATLVLARSWIGDERHVNSFATDIAGSFITALAPRADADAARALREALSALHGSADTVMDIRGDSTPAEATPGAVDLQRAFSGKTQTLTLDMQASRLEVHNTDATEEFTLSAGVEPIAIHGHIESRSAHGGTLSEQADLLAVLSGQNPVVLVNNKYTAFEPTFADTSRPPEELVAAVVLAESASSFPFSDMMVFDGRTAHSIDAIGLTADASRITYHDPWPKGSFLQEHNNDAGLKAEPSTVTPGAWAVAPSALQSVIYAVLFMPETLADVKAVLDLLTKPEQAIRSALEKRTQDPTDRRSQGETWQRIGAALAIENRHDLEVAAFRVAAALEPKSARIAAALCGARSAAGDEQAATSCQAAESLINGDPGLSSTARAALKRAVASHLSRKPR
jgi:hypothetical protein